MTQKIYNVIVGLGVLLALALPVLGTSKIGSVAYPAYEALTKQFGGGIVVGQSGDKLTNIYSNNCLLIASSYTVAASTTVPVDCAVTGVLPTDRVMMELGTSSTPGNGWSLDAVSASSTAGFITGRLVNNTGASALLPASIASSTPYFIVR